MPASQAALSLHQFVLGLGFRQWSCKDGCFSRHRGAMPELHHTSLVFLHVITLTIERIALYIRLKSRYEHQLPNPEFSRFCSKFSSFSAIHSMIFQASVSHAASIHSHIRRKDPFKRAFVCFAKGPMIIELLCVPLCYWSGAIRLMQDSRGGVTRTDKSLVSILHTREKQAWKDWTNGTDWFLLCLSLFSAGQGDRTFCVPWDLVIRSGLLSSRVLLVKHHEAF